MCEVWWYLGMVKVYHVRQFFYQTSCSYFSSSLRRQYLSGMMYHLSGDNLLFSWHLQQQVVNQCVLKQKVSAIVLSWRIKEQMLDGHPYFVN